MVRRDRRTLIVAAPAALLAGIVALAPAAGAQTSTSPDPAPANEPVAPRTGADALPAPSSARPGGTVARDAAPTGEAGAVRAILSAEEADRAVPSTPAAPPQTPPDTVRTLAAPALPDAIAALDAEAARAAIAAGARLDRPLANPPAFAAADALRRSPIDRRPAARALILALAEATIAADRHPEEELRSPFGDALGSFASRIATVPGEADTFLRVVAVIPPGGRCTVLRQMLAWDRDSALLVPPVAALIPLGSATADCARAFNSLRRAYTDLPGRTEALAALLATGVRPAPDDLADLLRTTPASEGDALFARLLASADLSARFAVGDGAPRSTLRHLADSVLERREERAGTLAAPERWSALLRAAPDFLACDALPRPLLRAWRPDEPAVEPWRTARRLATEDLLRRCPQALGPVVAEEDGTRLWRALHAEDAALFRAVLAAGLGPTDGRALAAEAACAADRDGLAATLDTDPSLAPALLGPFMACLEGLERARPGEVRTLVLLLARGASATAPVDGATPAALAAALDRDDIVAILTRHGAPRATLPPASAGTVLETRLLRLANVEAEDGAAVAPIVLGNRPAWLARGACATANCEYALILREGRRYRVALSDGGHTLRPEPTASRGMKDITVHARAGAAQQTITLWRYDGTRYRPARCTTLDYEDGAPGRPRWRRTTTACAQPG